MSKKVMIVLLACLIIFACFPLTASADFQLSDLAAGPSKSINSVPLYRYYNGSYSYHYYTLVGPDAIPGLNYEGIEGYILPTKLPGTVPLFHALGPSSSDPDEFSMACGSFLTTNEGEYNYAINNYRYYPQGIIGYVMPANSGADHTQNLFRWYYPGGHGDHFYTLNPAWVNEHQYEGVACDVWDGSRALAFINLLAPSKGETWTVGSKQSIKWETSSNVDFVNLYYSTNGGSDWKFIQKVDNTGSFDWTVPAGAVSTTCRIKAEWIVTDNGVQINNIYGSSLNLTVKSASSGIILLPRNPGLIIAEPNLMILFPSAPSGLTAGGSILNQKITLNWQDNSDIETGYIVQRKADAGTYAVLATLPADAKVYTDSSAAIGTKYTYRVKATGIAADSAWSNEASSSIVALSAANAGTLSRNALLLLLPAAPSDLASSQITASNVTLTWTKSAGTVSGYKIVRKLGSAAYFQVGVVGATASQWKDTGVAGATTYTYAVMSYSPLGNSDLSNEVKVTTPAASGMIIRPSLGLNRTILGNILLPIDIAGEKTATPADPVVDPVVEPVVEEPAGEPVADGATIELKFTIGRTNYYINGVSTPMDVSPFVGTGGRIMLPVKYILDPLKADYSWDSSEKSAAIARKTITMKLWANRNMANLNGSTMMIDPANDQVMPMMVPPGRTMMPLRFISEKLGGTVKWDAASETATIVFTN